MTADGTVLVADAGNHLVRRVTSEGVVTTLGGSLRVDATVGQDPWRFNHPAGVAILAGGDIVVMDTYANTLREIAPGGGIRVLAGLGAEGHADGGPGEATFALPSDAVGDADGNLYVADECNDLIRKISSAGVVTTIAGTFDGRMTGKVDIDGPREVARIVSPRGIARAEDGDLYVSEGTGSVRRVKADGSVTTLVSAGMSGLVDGGPGTSLLSAPRGLATDGAGNVYVADYGSRAIRKIASDGVVVTVAGNGRFGETDGGRTEASFTVPSDIAVGVDGSLYVADGQLIRKIAADGSVVTLAGQKNSDLPAGNGPRLEPDLKWISGIAVDGRGRVYASDSAGNRIVEIAADGSVSSVAGGRFQTFFGTTSGYRDGPASIAQFDHPAGLVAAGDGALYVADQGNHAIRKIKWGWVSTIAGGKRSPRGIHDYGIHPTGGFANGEGAQAEFSAPVAIAIEKNGDLIVADRGNRAIRRIGRDGVVSTPLGGSGQLDTALGASSTSIGVPGGVAALPDGRIVISVLNGVVSAGDAKPLSLIRH